MDLTGQLSNQSLQALLPNLTTPEAVAHALHQRHPAAACLAPLVYSYKQVAYAHLMATRRQTLYGIADSPVGLAAWLLDHGDGDGQPAVGISSALNRTSSTTGELTRDEILDNITLYWLTNTGVSASRLYWEYKGGFFNVNSVSIPVAVSIFPGEQYQAPRSWTEQAYPNLIYFNEVDKGGHFAAWEQPDLFASEVRAGLRSFR